MGTAKPATEQDATSGRLAVPGGQVAYRIVGVGDGTPALVLHGGPGLGHSYLRSLEALGDERPIVFYDQLGSGRSEAPEDNSLWRLERFVAEVEAVRTGLGLGRCHLFGHSFGGWLAIEFTLRHASAVAGLVLASSSASVRQYVAELRKLKATLPAADREQLDRGTREQRFEDPSYGEALQRFFVNHICRRQPWPEGLLESMASYGRSPVPAVMLGPDFFAPDGSMSPWDREAEIQEISSPTLVTIGHFDTFRPACATTLLNNIADSELEVFQTSGHMPHLDEPTAYVEAVRMFLRKADRLRRAGTLP